MNEELESTNAELQVVNNDLNARSGEIERLNTFLLAISGGLQLGAIVLDADLKVQVWNERAADLWGLRSDEVVGRPFFDQDIGLPTKDMRAMVRGVMRGEPQRDSIVLDATTRRGRRIRCRVTAHMVSNGVTFSGVVLMMEEVPDETSGAPD